MAGTLSRRDHAVIMALRSGNPDGRAHVRDVGKSKIISCVLSVLALAALLQARPLRAQPAAYAWRAADPQAEIQVFTSAVTRHRFDAVKATAVLPAPARHLLGVLSAFEHYPAWYYRASEVRVLHQPKTIPDFLVEPDGRFASVPETGPWLLFFRQRVPPVADRWTLLRCAIRAGAAGSLLVEFHSLQSTRTVDGAVHMDLRGYWQLRPLDAQRTEVTFMVDADPDTLAPAFIVDPELRGVVVETLQALGQRVRNVSSARPAATLGAQP